MAARPVVVQGIDLFSYLRLRGINGSRRSNLLDRSQIKGVPRTISRFAGEHGAAVGYESAGTNHRGSG
jgi:hypothetical protein